MSRLIIWFIFLPVAVFCQDSVTASIHASYDEVTGIHRWLFGENYRKDWAMMVKFPLIKISQLHGGLRPLRRGGGMESTSLRLEDSSGNEWVLRSVEKIPDKLLPENLQGTFTVDWVGDEFSGQHPFSALVMPPLAEAVHVPHANPVIGVVAADTALGDYEKEFAGTVCLLEEREPAGNSDNTVKMEHELLKNNATRFDRILFLKARMLDLLVGDWDRHEDQWRWAQQKTPEGKIYTPVPRDRDQVFHVTQGVFPSIAAWPWIVPTLENFDGRIPRVKFSLYKTRFIKCFPDAQFNFNEWTKTVNDFVAAETDEVLEAALKRLPAENYQLRHDVLFKKLKQRRDNIPGAMAKYYAFVNHVVDIRGSNKNELIALTDSGKSLRLRIDRLDKEGNSAGNLMDVAYDPRITKEIRIYTGAGNDRILIDNKQSPIKLRFTDSTGNKNYSIKTAASKIHLYGIRDGFSYTGNTSRVSNHFTDTAGAAFIPTNLYNVWIPQLTAAINADDGFLLGTGFTYKGVRGFRKLPYSTHQSVLVTHSFASSAFRIKYTGEWTDAIGKADFTLQANVQAPDNTVNFFGQGNETQLDKTDDYHRYYRTRFDFYQIDPALRWRLGKNTALSAGISFQYYHLDSATNNDRFIQHPSLINSYDSLSVTDDKSHLGAFIRLESNTRDNNLLPSKGHFLELTVRAYKGLNDFSKSLIQVIPAFTFYQKINRSGSIALSDRLGGGVSIGKPAFYQSLFLGGQGNLLGYLQNRFAGQQMLFNNLQARVKIADIPGYILPGQLGLTAFYDIGRVWISEETSGKWHQGNGGGIYFAPASLIVIQALAGHSEEGWYPYISLNFRL